MQINVLLFRHTSRVTTTCVQALQISGEGTKDAFLSPFSLNTRITQDKKCHTVQNGEKFAAFKRRYIFLFDIMNKGNMLPEVGTYAMVFI